MLKMIYFDKNLYLYQYSLNSLLYGYFTTVWMYPVLPSWKWIFMVFQIYHFALNLIHFWNFYSKDKLNHCIYLVHFHVSGEYYWLYFYKLESTWFTGFNIFYLWTIGTWGSFLSPQAKIKFESHQIFSFL